MVEYKSFREVPDVLIGIMIVCFATGMFIGYLVGHHYL